MAETSKPVEAALSLGGNVGDVAAAFASALEALRAHPQISKLRASRIWRTPPWGKIDQPDFLNMAVAFETTLTPRELLERIRELENKAGRAREERWGPRTLDLDIIIYGEETIEEPDLQIPHPRAHERAFVLIPLAEVMPDARLDSRFGAQSVAEWAKACDAGGMIAIST